MDCYRSWFARLHPTYQTPINSIVFVGAVTLAFSVLGLIGVGKQEAFQLLWNASGIFYGLTYLVMFALPLTDSRAPTWLKLAALSGFATTLLFVLISILPIVQVESRLLFAIKITSVVLIANGLVGDIQGHNTGRPGSTGFDRSRSGSGFGYRVGPRGSNGFDAVVKSTTLTRRRQTQT